MKSDGGDPHSWFLDFSFRIKLRLLVFGGPFVSFPFGLVLLFYLLGDLGSFPFAGSWFY